MEPTIAIPIAHAVRALVTMLDHEEADKAAGLLRGCPSDEAAAAVVDRAAVRLLGASFGADLPRARDLFVQSA